MLGAGMGAVGGAGLSMLAGLIGTVAAGITKTRTDEAQRKASTSSGWKYAIPGYAPYDLYKTIGKSKEVDAKKLKELREKYPDTAM